MLHQYNLKENPFIRIRDWLKKIEIRLLDDKRKNIKLLDEIEFSNDKLWKIRKKVIWIHYHMTIEDLLDSCSIDNFWPTTKEDIISRVYTYYSEEEQQKYWFIAIFID